MHNAKSGTRFARFVHEKTGPPKDLNKLRVAELGVDLANRRLSCDKMLKPARVAALTRCLMEEFGAEFLHTNRTDYFWHMRPSKTNVGVLKPSPHASPFSTPSNSLPCSPAPSVDNSSDEEDAPASHFSPSTFFTQYMSRF